MTDPAAIRLAWRALGRQLAQHRRAAGLTQYAFAPMTFYGRSTVANAETGRQHPDRRFWLRCDQVLGTGGQLTACYDQIIALERRNRRSGMAAELDARPARPAREPIAVGEAVPPQLGGSASLQWSAELVEPEFADEASFVQDDGEAYVGVERTIMAAARRTSEHAMNAGAWVVSEATIDQMRDEAAEIARGFARLTPAVAVSETLHLRAMAVAALERTGRPAQQRDLYLITAQAAALLASASCDLGLWPTAMQYARAADTYGEIIGHPGVRAYARGMQAVVAYWTGRPADAVRHALAAVNVAPSGTARVRALCVLARAWAHRGAVDEVQAVLNAAGDARDEQGGDELHDVVGGEFGFTSAQQARCASTAWLQVGRPDDAAAAAVTALRLAPSPSLPWSTVEAEARVDLATCQLLGGQLDAAYNTLAALWTVPPDWRRAGLVGRLGRMRSVLVSDHWRQVRKAQELAAQTEDFAASGPTPPPALPPP